MLAVACSAWSVDHRGADREGVAQAVRHQIGIVDAGIRQHDDEFLAAEPPDQIGLAQVRLRGPGEDLQHLVADRVAEAVVDRLEMVEVDQQHADRTVARDLLLQQGLGVLQEGAAVEQAGERIDHRGGLVPQLGALLRHREQDEGGRDRHQEGFEAEHAEPGAREDGCRRPRPCSSALSGVRSTNIVPCVTNSTIAGQREISGSLAARQNS